ncbi:LysE family translocator [Reinekea sp.]|jgi:threonine/homoserine/homoserine lactone efflux protein|uniref:LysE family translocator n=1 Tax=Reinekea sp. TaxID=1970455 RepID=UPI002A7F2BAA|nr:LysE family translocator [Reinekea sp.]
MSFNIALLLFAVASTGTPGPNNLMILASGLNFGIRRSIPHWLGIISGVPVMMLVIGMGLERVFTQWPLGYTLIKIVGASYLLYLAARIALTRVSGETRSAAKPLTFVQGALFQWVNPKAWVMCVGAIAAFTVADLPLLPQVVMIAATFMVVGLACVGCWLFAGSQLQRLLKNERQQRIFNISMALILAVSIIPMMAVTLN